MAAIKVEPDAHEEPEPVSSELEYQPNDADPIPMTFRFVKWDGKQEEPCDVTTIKEEVKNEIKTEDHKGCLDRSYSTEEVTLTVTNGKEEVKGETSTEDHEVCVDRIEELLIKEEHETVSSETDVTECLDCEWDCPVETDPLHSETNSGSSCILSQCSDNEENKGHKCELRKHTSDKSFICEICKKHFKKRRILVAHIRIHSGEKPFKCDLCNKSFSRRNNLKAHSRVHTGERPYKCDVCNKCFAVRCGLDIHSRIHTGEKPFKCEVCNKTFRQVSNLSHHSRTHTGEKPFKCEVCHKRFTRSSHLIAHSHLHARDRT